MTTTAEPTTTDHVIFLQPELIHSDKPQTKLPSAGRLHMRIMVSKNATDQAIKDEVLQTVRDLGYYLLNDTSPDLSKLVDTYTQAILNDRAQGEQ